MAQFRKWFPVLVVTLLLGATAASAQVGPAMTCSTNAGVPPILRSEGLTELAGDLVLNCTGGDPAQPFLANVQIFANTNITSKLLASPAGYTEALLMINEPTVPSGPRPLKVMPVTTASTYAARAPFNGFRGQKVSDTAVAWLGVPILPPGTNPNNTLVLRMTNIRVDATRLLPAGTTAGGLLPQQLIVYVSISGSTSVPVNNPQQVLGYVQNSFTFAVTNCGNTADAGTTSFRQCSSSQGDLFNPARTVYSNFGIRFTENFPTAFKDRTTPAGQESFASQVLANSEVGFMSASQLGTEVGTVNSATRLIARWTNVPKGVQIFVAANNVTFDATDTYGNKATYGGSKTLQANFVPNVDAYGATSSFAVGPTAPISPTAVLATRYPTCSSSDPSFTINKAGTTIMAGLYEVPLDATGSGVAVWEVAASSAVDVETAWFPVYVKYSANLASGTPALGTANVYGILGPAYPSTVSGYNVSTLDLSTAGGLNYPRFLDAPPATRPAPFRIIACQTNLLFPFVTNQAGFDTGIAIINTSRDPFSSNNANEGTCEIYYYGKLADGSALTKSKETSSVVPAGEYLAFSISGASTDSKVTGNPGFQGYIIARCNFFFGRGYAFISDYGAQKLAHGYLALVMNDGSAVRSGLSAAENFNN
jgi:hypothetical protein